ncbi:hypothetical protein C8Q74DRAFT_486925 [Fomes fomentarius]|nr:hypothetical protein C8Q74DRAFT_486925 [Fomes fomentarius]
MTSRGLLQLLASTCSCFSLLGPLNHNPLECTAASRAFDSRRDLCGLLSPLPTRCYIDIFSTVAPAETPRTQEGTGRRPQEQERLLRHAHIHPDHINPPGFSSVSRYLSSSARSTASAFTHTNAAPNTSTAPGGAPCSRPPRIPGPPLPPPSVLQASPPVPAPALPSPHLDHRGGGRYADGAHGGEKNR